MIASSVNENSGANDTQPEAVICPESPVFSSSEKEQSFLRNGSSRRNTQTSTGSLNPEEGSTEPLVSREAAAAAYTMSSGEFMHTTPLFVRRSKRNLVYKILCFLVLVLQGGILDFYLIVFTDLYWCSWIATDLVVVTGWGIFFLKNARCKRERACGFHQKNSIFGSNLGEFTYAYLAWLIYVIACTPKMVLILETSILDLIALKMPLGVTGFKITMMLPAPLLYCLINSIIEDLHGATRCHSQSCFMSTFLDLLDSFTLIEMLLKNEIPTVYLKYTVIAVYFLALAVPVLWLHELTASRMRYRWIWSRFLSGVLVNAPVLVVRCFLVYVYKMPLSVFMFKNMFFVSFRCLEFVDQCLTIQEARRLTSGNLTEVSHCVSENDMCPHGYVNTLAVTTQS
ncbi:transmembrane protein 121B-like [Megalops cyprinoides]|uniref:transmembrane protein 121B-like n=1 Tax=Megalops cyprinoides TaxID=118141 RepID=UPI0018644262|nr:transmembrane protein 121B-like [Megalops cyprinoides]